MDGMQGNATPAQRGLHVGDDGALLSSPGLRPFLVTPKAA